MFLAAFRKKLAAFENWFSKALSLAVHPTSKQDLADLTLNSQGDGGCGCT